MLNVKNLEEACEALRVREQIPEDSEDGFGVFTTSNSPVGVIPEGALFHQLDAVIWTALPPRFENTEGLIPTVDDAVSYLAGLSADAQEPARTLGRCRLKSIRPIEGHPWWTGACGSPRRLHVISVPAAPSPKRPRDDPSSAGYLLIKPRFQRLQVLHYNLLC